MRKNEKPDVKPSAPFEEEPMRLDKFLKVSRIIKRRSLANEACATGHVMLNGREAKPGAEVKVGDIISVRFGERLTQYEVTRVKEHVMKAEAAEMYRAIPG